MMRVVIIERGILIEPPHRILLNHASHGAAQRSDVALTVAAIALLAGTGVPGRDVLAIQMVAMLKSQGVGAEAIDQISEAQKRVLELAAGHADDKILDEAVRALVKAQTGNESDEGVAMAKATMATPWMRRFLVLDPKQAIAQVRCPVLVMNGDLMVQFEPEQLLRRHDQTGAVLTVATRGYQHQVPFGVVEQDDDGLVRQITEKPTVTMSVNAGVYAVSPEALALVPEGVESTMPQLLQRCLDRGSPVAAWPLASEWIDVGTPGDLARAKGGT